MNIKTNNTIKASFLRGTLKAKELINFLLNNGFKATNTNVSLSNLSYEGKQIKNVQMNQNNIIIKF